MFCQNCGAKVNTGSKFCGSCGQKIEAGAGNKVSDTWTPTNPPPPKAPMAPPPPAGSMIHSNREQTQSFDGNPGNQPNPGYPPGQMYGQGTGPGPLSGQGFPGQQFNPQFNQKQKSSKGCLIGILVVVLLLIILAVVGFLYVYFAADLGSLTI